MNKPYSPKEMIRYKNGSWHKGTDQLIEETKVSLMLNGEEAVVLMATPGREEQLAAGFAVTMGWADPASEPCKVEFAPGRGRVFLQGSGLTLTQPGPKSAGGGPLGPDNVKPMKDAFTMDGRVLLGLTDILSDNQKLHLITGACHAVALFDEKGGLLAIEEDAGRHNALDKAVGSLWLKGRLGLARAAAFSGRMSLEMVLKIARAGVPVSAAVGAPTAPAMRKADEAGLTLAGFCRNGGLNLYTHAQRITLDGGPLKSRLDPAPKGEPQVD